MKKNIITLSFLVISSLLISQTNLDFENGTTGGWAITGGGGASIVNSGNDPLTGFPRVFPGGGASSMMLSNGPNANFTDGNASQSFMVTQLNACLIVRYAVVLGSPGHGCAACSPQFNAGVFLNGQPLPCSTISANAGCSPVGWSAGAGGSTFLPWTVTAFDLRPFIGSNVTIQINTADCCGGAHWAYSYVDCTAQPMGLYLNGSPIPSNQTNNFLCNGVNNIISAPPGFNYLWSSSDPASPVNGVTTQSINATQAATYSVNLSVPGLNCARVNLWSTFGFVDVPTAYFDAAPVCYGAPVSFTNASITPTLNASLGIATTYSWNFDDGTPIESSTDPTHLYLTANPNANNLYNVVLTAASQNCIDQVTRTVFIGSNPMAAFNSNIVCFGSTTQIQDVSNGNGNALSGYAFDFNFDGTIDVTGVGNPAYLFPYEGDNAVSYTVSTNPTPGLTCYHSISNNVLVDPSPNPNFSFVNNCINNQPNTLDASISTISSGTNDVYDWNYGDGQTASINTQTTSHIYANPGTYPVNLTVTSNKGCVKSITHPVEVYPKPIVTISISPLTCLGGTSTLTANTMLNSGNIVEWEWDIDNTLSTKELTGKQTSFVFPTEGLQTINLVATTNHGCKENFTSNLYINYIPKPEFVVDFPNGCSLPHCVTLTDNSTITGPARITNWNWNFDNGITSNQTSGIAQNTCYTNMSSSQLALYTLTLTTKTDSGCVGVMTKKDFITVFPKPVAQFTFNPNPSNIVTPLVSFDNQSLDYIKWWWDFGDKSKKDSVNVNPSHFYESTTADTYMVALIVANQYGCRDTALVNLTIGPEFVFYIPNAFTPSEEDDVNKTFTGKGIGIEKYEMWIHDRWGDQVYYTDDINKGWDGKTQGKGIESKQDVYIWKVKLKSVLGKKHDYVGHVTLLR